MADQVQAQPSLTAVLAVAIETQRNVLRTHAALAKKKLKPRAIHELRVALRRLLTTLALAEALGLCMEARSLRTRPPRSWTWRHGSTRSARPRTPQQPKRWPPQACPGPGQTRLDSE